MPNFNSRPREGANIPDDVRREVVQISIPAPARGRTGKVTAEIRRSGISIPAPARGRTSPGDLHSQRRFYFNSRPREGANGMCCGTPPGRSGFQFPPPRGGEPFGETVWVVGRDFNSRPREGANNACIVMNHDIGISIPAPARGRTANMIAKSERLQISIPAPARGRTISFRVSFCHKIISIPAPARGRTFSFCKVGGYCVFQFPPPRGGEPSFP